MSIFTEKTISKLEKKCKQTLEKIKRALMNDLLTGEKSVKLEVAR